MKWIKTSERLPQKYGNVIFRQISSKVVLSLSMAIEWISEGDINNVEWLDESIEGEDARREEDAIHFAEWCGENSVGYEECVWFYKDKTGRYNYSTEKMWELFNQSITRKP